MTPDLKQARRRHSRITWFLLIVLALATYPGFVLAYTWSHVLQSPLPGGRHGPLDAYRHTLASAVVAYTLDARAIRWVNNVMERRGKRSNAMDIHNNLIGASIGSQATRFSDIEPAVTRRIATGTINATAPDQITWLPEPQWQEGSLR
ncbi:hypothetical protein [Pseudoxanthomonas sp. PXM02]|uniref:hypothetical protein n=1 Tax=Pseudoxanthomonas sp. PXM02 TaxID=2769294 RepID=UPI00177E2D4F|nr:hypothetical protein [Pseudoxanthomonas sp. PXM02]MBD9477975.1 hypothetical protein [Pseudoxanthomonas sp. PXM02]